MTKTTVKQYEFFVAMCERWQEQFGLKEWGLYYQHASIPDRYAQTSWSTGDMVATIQFCTHWDDWRPLTEKEIDRLALHEILHVLLAPFSAKAEARYTTQDSIDLTEHSIVRRIEHVLNKEVIK